MRYELEQIGLKAKTESIPFVAAVVSRAGNPKIGGYDMAALGWQADYPDPSNFINVLFDGAMIPTGDGVEQQLVVLQQPEVQHADEQGRTADR